MQRSFSWLVVASACAGAVSSIVTVLPVTIAQPQQSSFPDVQPDYWAYPFIQRLAEREIIEGYLDGTFRPEQAIQRDEFSAMIRQAFEFDPQRQIQSAPSAFTDVPQDYWAASAIEETYQMGVLGTPEENSFRPEANISRLDAIIAIGQQLDLPAQPQAVEPVDTTPPQRSSTIQSSTAKKTPNQLAFPLAATALMSPLFSVATPSQSSAEPDAPATEASPEPVEAQAEAVAEPANLSAYYNDVDQIPEAQRELIQNATRAGLIVNHPDVSQFAPNEPLQRGGATALVHQALVLQGRIDPLPADSSASQYVVTPPQN